MWSRHMAAYKEKSAKPLRMHKPEKLFLGTTSEIHGFAPKGAQCLGVAKGFEPLLLQPFVQKRCAQNVCLRFKEANAKCIDRKVYFGTASEL